MRLTHLTLLLVLLLVPLSTASAQESPPVQQITGSVAPGQSEVFRINNLSAGQVLYAFMENTSGNLDPILFVISADQDPAAILQSYQQDLTKLLASSTQPLLDLPALRDRYALAWDDDGGPGYTAALQFSIPKDGDYYLIAGSSLSAAGRNTEGDYRLLIGVDAPEVLTGTAAPTTTALAVQDQSVLGASLVQEFTARLDETQPSRTLKLSDFDPGDTLYVNLQATSSDLHPILLLRDYSNKPVQVANLNGHAAYLERFTTNFQLDFDWTAYPFDRQDFYIKADLLNSEDDYIFVPTENFDEIDPNHGEDEFIITGFDTQITSELSSRRVPTSRYTFHFAAPRHLDYYLFRIFVPILLIVTVSYITFFLKDYGRRIEIATGNLLLFIAFSWSLGDNYPRMGYLTFLDAIMAITFVINTAVVALNVYYKWLEQNGQRDKADRLEAPMNYVYPIAYIVSFGLAAALFLR